MSRVRISATAAKSRPKQGFDAISTATSSASSRASTARCTLPPDRLPIGASGSRRADAVGGDQPLGVAPQRAAADQRAGPRERVAIEVAEADVLRHRHAADAGVAQRLVWQAAHLQRPHVAAPGAVGGAADRDRARRSPRAGRPAPRPALPGRCRRRPAMPTISPAPTFSEKSRTAGRPQIVDGRDAGDVQHHVVARARAAAAAGLRRLFADHHARHRVGRQVGHPPLPRRAPAPQHRHLVGEGHHLAELVRDHQDRVESRGSAERTLRGRVGEPSEGAPLVVSSPSVAIWRKRPSTSSASAGVSTLVGSSRITILLPR